MYIARTEGSSEGRISWKFDFSPVGLKIKSVSIMAASQTFQSGRVCWCLQAGPTTTEFSGGTITNTAQVNVTLSDSLCFPLQMGTCSHSRMLPAHQSWSSQQNLVVVMAMRRGSTLSSSDKARSTRKNAHLKSKSTSKMIDRR